MLKKRSAGRKMREGGVEMSRTGKYHSEHKTVKYRGIEFNNPG